MNEFWLGAFVALAAWKGAMTVGAAILASVEYTTTWTHAETLSELFQAFLFVFLALLVYTGIIP